MEESTLRFPSAMKARSVGTQTSASESRVGMDARSFKRSVLDHVLFTYARSLQDASPRDVYRAMAHAVRDRLVHRWLATQRTYEEHDAKLVYYLSSEFLTGRSLGLCLPNMGLYEIAEAMAAERGFDLGSVLDQEGDPGLGNGRNRGGGLTGRRPGRLLRTRARLLYDSLATHMAYEERVLSAALSDVIGWGAVIHERMEADHARQREELSEAIAALTPDLRSLPALVEDVRSFARTLLHDMETEEEGLAKADLDALVVDVKGG